MDKKNVIVTSGEPGGIGPDICLDIALHCFDERYQVVVLCDFILLQQRKKILNHPAQLRLINYDELNNLNVNSEELLVINFDCANRDCLQYADPRNAQYVLDMLDYAVNLCQNNRTNIIVTGPINKASINQAGIKFSGHTDYLASKFGVVNPVMLLRNDKMKVALLTTHIPLKDVPNYITTYHLELTLRTIVADLINKSGRSNPSIAVCGLNPHAGENGYLGDEEIKVINPVINKLRQEGVNVSGAHPGDTVFLNADAYDVILAMYHDQGLAVLKYSGFESGINVTMGLPIIRTSVDHGTALSIAGTGQASSSSMIHAINAAIEYDLNQMKITY